MLEESPDFAPRGPGDDPATAAAPAGPGMAAVAAQAGASFKSLSSEPSVQVVKF